MTSRWSAPTSSRTRCGTTMPTKPMGPPIDTAAPVASDALKNASRCTRKHVHATAGGVIIAKRQQVQRPWQPQEDAAGHERASAAPPASGS